MLVKVNEELVIETVGILAIFPNRDMAGHSIENSCIISYGVSCYSCNSHSPAAMLEFLEGFKVKFN